MVNREEYERVVDSFLMELRGICSAINKADLNRLPGFAKELRESIAMLCDPSTADEDVVGLAFGIVDVFMQAEWADIMEECYALYVDMSGGKSHRHPDAAR
jgi:hypothetical protein